VAQVRRPPFFVLTFFLTTTTPRHAHRTQTQENVKPSPHFCTDNVCMHGVLVSTGNTSTSSLIFYLQHSTGHRNLLKWSQERQCHNWRRQGVALSIPIPVRPCSFPYPCPFSCTHRTHILQRAPHMAMMMVPCKWEPFPFPMHTHAASATIASTEEIP